MLRISIGLAVVYFSIGGYIWWAMNQPPEQFAKVMARMPGPVPFLLFPFETLWLRARAGHLQVGDLAPVFSLAKLDKSDHVLQRTVPDSAYDFVGWIRLVFCAAARIAAVRPR